MRGRWYFVDWVAGAVWDGGWGLEGEVKRGDEGVNGGLLGRVDGEVAVYLNGGDDFVTKEMGGIGCEFDEYLVVFGEASTKFLFYGRGLTEVDEVVNV